MKIWALAADVWPKNSVVPWMVFVMMAVPAFAVSVPPRVPKLITAASLFVNWALPALLALLKAIVPPLLLIAALPPLIRMPALLKVRLKGEPNVKV